MNKDSLGRWISMNYQGNMINECNLWAFIDCNSSIQLKKRVPTYKYLLSPLFMFYLLLRSFLISIWLGLPRSLDVQVAQMEKRALHFKFKFQTKFIEESQLHFLLIYHLNFNNRIYIIIWTSHIIVNKTVNSLVYGKSLSLLHPAKPPQTVRTISRMVYLYSITVPPDISQLVFCF